MTGPFDEIMRALGREDPVKITDIKIARASRVSALGWYRNARYESEIGALDFSLARLEPRGSDVRADLIDRAIAAERRGIALAPTAAFSWIRLAQAEIEKEGAGADIVPFLRMSYRVAPNDPRFVLTRLELAFVVWDSLPDDVRDATNHQIRLAMKWFPRDLVRHTRTRYRLAEVREALAEDPDARARFNLLYFLRRGDS